MAAPTLGLRHAVLWVSDPTASAEFYADVLGLETKAASPDAVFMASPSSLTDHDLGLFRAPPGAARPRQIGLYHLSWEVPTLDDLAGVRQRLVELGSYVGENNHGVSRSVYAHDPDGIEFEVMWELPIELIEPDEPSNVPLDLDADIARFGADTPGRGG
jgi:catechol-2,3-dioxygenase